uniref:Restriction of telomere capping protein 4 n=1 Tax=Mycena chlorophos TaxID=658473 RepID=A0ABQ0M7L5_MYCCL|nr:predicted protein [Mycena chlorophos]
MASVPDPDIVPRTVCGDVNCSSPMGDVRLHEGSDDAKNGRKDRGRVVQTCKRPGCHYTCHLTPQTFLWADGAAFIKRYELRSQGKPVPPELAAIPLRVAPATDPEPIPNPAGGIFCGNTDCMTRARKRTAGAVKCIDRLCKSCCLSAAREAEQLHRCRDPCKAHGTSATSDHASFVPVAVAVPAPPPIAPPPPSPAKRATAGGSRRKPLAQPMAASWQQVYRTKQATDATVLDAKSAKLDMESRQKVEIDLVIYWKKDTPAARFPVSVTTFPHLQLDHFPVFLTMAKLGPTDMLDLWVGGGWKIITISQVVTVETGRAVLLKKRPSLEDEWVVADCPGLDAEIKLQPIPRQPPHAMMSPRSVQKRRFDDLAGEDGAAGASKVAKTTVGDAARASHQAVVPVPFPDITPPAPIPMPALPPVAPRLAPAPVLTQTGASRVGGSAVLPKPQTIPAMFVCDWVDGWERVAEFEREKHPRLRYEKHAFPEVFGFAYVKATVSGYKARVKKVPLPLVECYTTFGRVADATVKNLLAEAETGISLLPNSAPTVAPHQQHPPLPPGPVAVPVVAPVAVPVVAPTAPGPQTPPPRLLDTLPVAPSPARSEDGSKPPSNTPWGCCDGCNEAYAAPPSPTLKALAETLRSTVDDDERHAKQTQYCLQHRFEAGVWRLGCERRWPESINYDALHVRVEEVLEEVAEGVLGDPRASSFFSNAVIYRNHYTCPPTLHGYFGKLAYRRILEAVDLHFAVPDNAVDPVSIDPLPPYLFIDQVVVPEVIVALIMADLGQDPDAALDTLHSSMEFGSVFHSDPGLENPSSPSFTAVDLLSVSTPLSLGSELESELEVAVGNLCPFCDEPLPDQPSPELTLQLQTLVAISTLDPFPHNPHHRDLHFSKYLNTCLRHRVEREAFATARTQNWPFAPDFATLFDRVQALQPQLGELLEDVENSRFFRDSRAYYGSGKRATVEQQMMDPRQPMLGAAYYGEAGYGIISTTVRWLFPATPALIDVCAPLSYDIFVREVLLPECIVRIVRDDLGITVAAAKKLIIASYEFGMVLHPDGSEDEACDAVQAYIVEHVRKNQ